jgi:cell fate regulator YaaT (PSP1 superfamily)
VELASSPLVSVRFSPAGRPHLFLLDADVPLPRPGEPVVVRTDAGPAIGMADVTVTETAARRGIPPASSPLRVVRRATDADIVLRLKHEQREREAREYAVERVRTHDLPMKLSRVEQSFDGSRLVFYFTADTRVDFRELVRELAARFRTRIEMRQIGVRDEARMLGGYGSCGRPLCCSTWLTSFEPVSIRMAKQQDLSLNPSKLSGLCGRLKCCLRYELPNSKGARGGGCGDEGGCDNPTGCGTGGCGSGCTGCGH